jgi:hypothetical protein
MQGPYHGDDATGAGVEGRRASINRAFALTKCGPGGGAAEAGTIVPGRRPLAR